MWNSGQRAVSVRIIGGELIAPKRIYSSSKKIIFLGKHLSTSIMKLNLNEMSTAILEPLPQDFINFFKFLTIYLVAVTCLRAFRTEKQKLKNNSRFYVYEE